MSTSTTASAVSIASRMITRVVKSRFSRLAGLGRRGVVILAGLALHFSEVLQ